jgi:hypothetical protein
MIVLLSCLGDVFDTFCTLFSSLVVIFYHDRVVVLVTYLILFVLCFRLL